jgi:hypothetical protein
MLRVIDPAGDAPGLPELQERLEIRVIDALGRTRALPRKGRADGFTISTRWQLVPAPDAAQRAVDVEISLVSLEERAEGLGIQVALGLDGEARRFMVPGIFYGENRPLACDVRFPRFDTEADNSDGLTSDHWAFRADRASHVVVFGWTESECLALATDEHSALGLTGLGFSAKPAGELLLNFPAREEPVTYIGHDAPAPPEISLHRWQAGEIATLRFTLFVGLPDPQAYNSVLRALYLIDRTRHELNPWMPVEEAAALTAEGLYRWHYRADHGILAEATAFERPINEMSLTSGDRETMHVAWISGAPSAFALLTYGRNNDLAAYTEAGIAVLDTIASGLSPSGLFWGQWSPEGWEGGWNGHPDWVQARTVAEATLFTIRALRFEQGRENDHPAWKAAIVSNLQSAIRSQQGGAFPSYVNARSGAPEGWEGAAGLLWIPALIEGAGYLEAIDALAAAEMAGSHYASFVEEDFIYGAPEDVHLTPTSEDAYNAVIAYVTLFEATSEERWLELARRAADWMMTFRWSYNLAFPEHTMLETYDFRSRGADLASPRNQHLQAYGLICLPEMMRLAEHTGDIYYTERTRDNLACFLQFIAREDGDFNARRGMVSERYYNTRCSGPKGAILPISHAWSAGLVLYACQAGISIGD